MNPSTDFK